MPWYIAGRAGEPFVDTTLHADADCAELGTPNRPLAKSSATGEQEKCPACTDGGVCTVVKADDEVCGRDLPCQYHD